jgi:CheY-like chemotaxis protein
MNGIELIQRVRQEMPEMPIVVMTAVSDATNLLEHELGIQWLLTKPFELEDLSDAVRQALG